LNNIAPDPRYRLYTSLNSYTSFAKDVLTGRLQQGSDVESIEKMLCDFLGVSYAVCTPMCRVGIYLVVKFAIKGERKRVIMSPYTIADVVNMVISAGGEPVFADIEADSCNINPDEVEKLIDEHTAAVLVTHLHGIDAQVERIREICDQFNALLLEDVAQAFGAEVHGRRLGSIGDAGIYSFGTYKNISAWYGGAVVSNDKSLIDSVRAEVSRYEYQSMAFLGKRIIKGLVTDISTSPLLFKPFTYWVFRYGYLHDIKWINRFVETELDLSRVDRIPDHYRRQMTPFQARLLHGQLSIVDEHSRKRIEDASSYYAGLKHLEELVIPSQGVGRSRIFSYFPIQYKARKKLLKWLMRNKRDVAAQHLKNCADLPGFSAFYRDCPVARKVADEVILLPTYPRYSRHNVEANIKAICSFFA